MTTIEEKTTYMQSILFIFPTPISDPSGLFCLSLFESLTTRSTPAQYRALIPLLTNAASPSSLTHIVEPSKSLVTIFKPL